MGRVMRRFGHSNFSNNGLKAGCALSIRHIANGERDRRVAKKINILIATVAKAKKSVYFGGSTVICAARRTVPIFSEYSRRLCRKRESPGGIPYSQPITARISRTGSAARWPPLDSQRNMLMHKTLLFTQSRNTYNSR